MSSDIKFICKQGSRSEHRPPFSYALEILGTNKDLFMEFLTLPKPKRASFINPVLNDKLSKCESKGAANSGQGSTYDRYLENMDRNGQYSSETSFMAQPDKIVILKPASLDIKCSDKESCHCSSLPDDKKSRGKILKAKPASISLKEMKSKLKNTFAGTRKGPSQFFMDDNFHGLITSRSNFKVGECNCRQADTNNSFSLSENVEIKDILCKRPWLKSIKGPDIVYMSNTVRTKLDFPSVSLSRKQEFDVIFEPRRHLSTRVKYITEREILMKKKFQVTLEKFLSSPDHDFLLINPRMNGQCCPGSAHMRFSPFSNSRTRNPSRTNKEVTSWDDFKIYGGIENLERKTSPSWIRSTVDQAHDTIIDAINNMNGMSMIEELSFIQHPELTHSELLSEINSGDDVKTRQKIDGIKQEIHLMNSLSENEILVPTEDDTSSNPSYSGQLNISGSIKYQAENQTPVSVLEPFLIDGSISSQSILLQTADQESVQPPRLDFEEQTSESVPRNPQTNASSSMNGNNYTLHYVKMVLQASCLNWDRLLAMKPPHQELLDPSLFYEVEFLPVDSATDPKLLFDHINEVLLHMYPCHFYFPPWMAFAKPKMVHLPLVEAVLYEIMRQADYYLLPRTEKRTLNQIISKDVVNARSWLDLRFDTEQIVVDISEEVLEESVIDIILEFLI
ncbi:hypothetical protein F511_14301 [Dorcoceras hygrometricum]|uniref:DUF4378 domain-containing protein n=1 Tax=Dorcoceras hygrometricum TaxID=472368 RepID=A0A2Z7BNT6_9LAMI|nr:hypothetical protein F511_14301 [Dorcoceras hygrometricum]